MIYIGRDTYMNNNSLGEPLKIRSAESKIIFLGNNNMFSWSNWIINSDLHTIYSIQSHKRINHASSIFIGDHCWFGQSATTLKGTHIGSGSVVGADSVVSGKKIPSNTVWAGNPARQIKDKIFWVFDPIYKWGKSDIENHLENTTDEFTYKRDRNSLSFDEIDRFLSACPTVDDRLDYLFKISEDTSKNRFAI